MTIAAATSEDLQAIVRVERAAAEAPHWSESEYAAIVEGAVGGTVRRCLLVASSGDELAGFAVGKIVLDEAELESVVVRASNQRQGIGRDLCQSVLTWAWGQGAESVVLEVRSASAGAMELYKALGFREEGRRDHYYSEPPDGAVLMRLDRNLRSG